MLITTTPTVDGRRITIYLGVIGAEVIFGGNFLKDWLAEGDDFWGGRSTTYEKVYADARKKAIEGLTTKAIQLGAHAVIGVRFDYSVLGAANGMMMVAATGTAVGLDFNKEELALQAQREKEDAAVYFVEIGGKPRGPFSIVQLRELLAAGRVEPAAKATTDSDQAGVEIRLLISN